ncbi:hypothetical protein METBIDRAFT_77378 [Metschnikowia bicuspidata var. bicuspidata NRRL YB-4993]|uniref:Mitochondrial escape protein 2 n=1 Tax=Metschnikowia bicuspidata var. bicuspidata NRRL YB-4993 TaxID=869754 RepID=A0A1A0HCS9_9ASCO|nr:hypothetical protein METBIDRAFT_77378 [Metschnikowia bicuspidata var. bicuspidata NRRL YB-4993]OBA21811.1 hypothetical protein METBIDRAFT_77378 [Metschnikowia bicuspidata var. bicuspidata NRRL YB-4993]
MTGVLDYLKQDEVLIFFDNLYPRWLAKLAYTRSLGYIVRKLNPPVYDSKVKEMVVGLVNNDSTPLPAGARCESFVPLKRDGGAFVKFLVPPNSNPKDLVATIEKNLESVALGSSLVSYWKFVSRFPKALQVKGTPWIEDLSRFPSRKLKVIFQGDSLTEEELYQLFRRYGPIVDIIPSSSSVPHATVLFKSTDPCVRAKNCVTGLKLNEGKTTLHLQYIPILRANHISAFIASHQKIAIPVILALLATIAVLIFEPIRQYFILMKIRHYYSWEAHKDKWYIRALYIPYSMIASSLSDSRHFIDNSLNTITGGLKKEVNVDDLESDMFWTERLEKANQLRLWVCENANTFIIVKGPKGSAEREFVIEHALNIDDTFKKRLLEIDCASLIKTRSDKSFLKTAAAQLGYFPLFTWTNSVSQFVDLGLQGLTGQKSGLSESKETQYKNMLLLALVAIRNVALSDFSAYKNEVERQYKMKSQGLDVEPNFAAAREEDYLQMHPEVKPVIVINNFLRKSDSPQDFMYKALADWAGQLIQSNSAHVIFITQDSGSTLHLTSALPNQVFKTITLDDASNSSAKQYVLRQLRDTTATKNIDSCLEPLGGRMLDLQAFVRRVKSGEEPVDALNEMIHQASEQITTFFLNKSPDNSDSEIPWNTAQLWALIRALARNNTIEMNELVKSPLFSLNTDTVATLAVLEKNDLISLKRDKGIVKKITTGRPLFKAAFKDLVEDKEVFKLYETFFFSQLISLENNKISKLEDQISKLASTSDFKFMKERIDYLSGKVNASTLKVQEYESNVKEISAMGTTKKASSFFGF